MHRTAVGVLRGGVSDGYASSLRSGASVLQALPSEQYDVRDVLIDREGAWHLRGVAVEPMRALHGLDVVINALYNDALGKSGEVARALKQSGVPYTGTRGTTASLASNRMWMRNALAGSEVRMARAQSYGRSGADVVSIAKSIFAEFGPPYVIKPVAAGTAVGSRIVQTLQELPEILDEMFVDHEALLVEEFLPGTQVSVGVIEGFRKEPFYTLPVAQFIMPEGTLIADLSMRESGAARHTYPWVTQGNHKNELKRLARVVHQSLGLAHYSRSDFVVRGPYIYLVGVNALPELHEMSSFVVMLDAVGATLPHFLEHVIALAREQ